MNADFYLFFLHFDFLQNAAYEYCTPNDEIIKNFWRVFTEFSVEQKKDFLSK